MSALSRVPPKIRHWLLTLWERRFQFPLSSLGLGVALSAYFIFKKYGQGELDYVLYSIAIVTFFILFTAVVSVLSAAVVLRWRLKKDKSEHRIIGLYSGPEHLDLESNRTAVTGYTFPRFRIWPFVQVRVSWATPDKVAVNYAKAQGRWQEIVTPKERAMGTHIKRRFLCGDIFGLARFAIYAEANQPFTVYPSLAPVTGSAITQFVASDALSHPIGTAEGDLLEIRKYGPGDPLKHILWKAFARTRKLLVRHAERAVSPSPSNLAYFISGPNDEPIASVARFFLESGLLGQGFHFQADGSDKSTSSEKEAVLQIIRSVDFRHRAGEDLLNFLKANGAEHRKNVVIFAPPEPGPWLTHLARARSYLHNARLVTAIDHQLNPTVARRLKKLLFAPPTDGRHPALAQNLANVIKNSHASGLTVRVLHRPSGELLNAATLEAFAK